MCVYVNDFFLNLERAKSYQWYDSKRNDILADGLRLKHFHALMLQTLERNVVFIPGSLKLPSLVVMQVSYACEHVCIVRCSSYV